MAKKKAVTKKAKKKTAKKKVATKRAPKTKKISEVVEVIITPSSNSEGQDNG